MGQATRNLMVTEVAKMLGFKRKHFYEWLNDYGYMLKTNGRWLPTDYHIINGTFKVTHTLVDKENFRAVVPVIRVTEKGFNRISGKVQSKSYSNIYWLIVSNLQQAVKKLGITRKEYDQRVIHWYSDDRTKGKYIIDFGSPNERTFLEYDYNDGKVWQTINT